MVSGLRGFGIFILLLLGFPALQAQDISSTKVPDTREVTIGNVYITGHKKTREEIILRELDFEAGQTISRQALAESLELARQKLTNTRLFVIVEIVPLEMSDTEVDILIRLQERWYIFPVPIFRLADRNFTEWWRNQNRDFSRVNYGLRVLHFNLTGRNDRLQVTTQFGFTKNYAVQYQIPYINKKQTLGLTVSSGFTNNKTVSFNTRNHRLRFVESEEIIRRRFATSASLTYRPNFFSRHSLNAAYTRTSIADTLRNANPEYLLDGQKLQRYFRLSYIYSWDKRDYFAYPLSGKLYRLELNKIGLGFYDDINMFTVRASWGEYFDLGKNFYLANRISGYYNFNDTNDIPYLLRSGFGYRPNFIRGYERYVVEGQSFISNRSAFRWKFLSGVNQLSKRSIIPQFQTLPYAFYLKAFLDLGYVGEPLDVTQGNFFNQTLLLGAGMGLDVVAYYDFVVRFEFSVNKEGQTGFFINFRSAL